MTRYTKIILMIIVICFTYNNGFAKTITAACGELSGLTYGYDKQGNIIKKDDGYKDSITNIIWDTKTQFATISSSDANGNLFSDKGIAVDIKKDKESFIVIHNDEIELWTLDNKLMKLLYSSHKSIAPPSYMYRGVLFTANCNIIIN